MNEIVVFVGMLASVKLKIVCCSIIVNYLLTIALSPKHSYANEFRSYREHISIARLCVQLVVDIAKFALKQTSKRRIIFHHKIKENHNR